MKYIFSLGLHFTKKTKYTAYIVLIGAIVNIGLNFALIPLINIYGAALASTISSILVSILYYKYAQKFYKVGYEIIKITKIIIVAIALYFISLFTSATSLWVGFFIKIALLGSFPFLLYFWNFFEDIELVRIKQAWKKWRNPLDWKKNMQEMLNKSKTHKKD
jgi:O-antigen/teichoic acid export membrane protein